ncbi:Myb-like protein L [Zancudomyces culisetae]|uniref:Myb-like protein L n=1 Tax=Zancudomyces culisetae TaxID=1213189 RepID=A0A1R1PG99_ZANCU|nr:Myb-like protein L [Zancudomyces culisetae]|eukprot:OMH80001.1 Myb-like protein L [Zancudomyces culisetae]
MIENIRYEDGSSIKHLFDMINLSIAEEGADEGENAELENAAMSREKEGEFRRFRNWTPESDKELLQLVEKHGEKWTKVASLMSGTPCSTIAVYSRYKTLQRAIKGKVVKIRKKHKPTSKWSAEDSEKLKNLVTESLEKEEIFSWKKISEKMGDRTSSQCRYRYINYLSPFLNTSGKFTAKEDYLILSHVMGHDKISWVKISQALSYTRSEVHVRSRSQSTINIYLLLKSYGINLKLQKNITSLDQIDTSDPDYILFEKTRELCLCHKYFVRPSEEALKKLFISH